MNTRNRCARALNSVCAHAGQTNLVIAVVGLVLTIGGSYKAIQAHQRPATHDPDDKLCHILGSEQPSQVQVPSNGWNDNNLSLQALTSNHQDVRKWEKHFQQLHPVIVQRFLGQAQRWAPRLGDILRQEGVPREFIYLALIESGLDTRAASHRQAVGIWQIRPATARRYGLTVSKQVDERRHPEKSTRAAARYLRDLYERFGSWKLAAAAYNVGPTWVQRTLEAHKANTFWKLSEKRVLPSETQDYVPKFLAVIRVAQSNGLSVRGQLWPTANYQVAWRGELHSPAALPSTRLQKRGLNSSVVR